MVLNEQSDFVSYGTWNTKNHIMFIIAYGPYLWHVKVRREKTIMEAFENMFLFLEAISSICLSICLGHTEMVLFATVTPVTVLK